MNATAPNPLALVAELTHRCPLHCVYCSNPQELARRKDELSTEAWTRIFYQAAQFGVLQVDLTGGEPLARNDLADLIGPARAAGLYTSLITSGIGADERRVASLVAAGLDHVQLSFQDSRGDAANEIAGARAHAQKLAFARWARKGGVALTLNFVVHRQNLDRLEEMIALAEELGADRVEVAHVQYYGWAYANREHLLPTRSQLDRSLDILQGAEERLRGRIKLEWVVPDYFARYPKACMGGWGRKIMLITPAGLALPCHAAQVIPGLRFDNAQDVPLRAIWKESEAFRKFRGEDWMSEPCRSCDRRSQDFGGCRCQAFLLAGDAAATDPVCSLSPRRGVVDAVLSEIRPATSPQPGWTYRPNPA
jgi:pyrroloquinoline quinone biosynthesis protein E